MLVLSALDDPKLVSLLRRGAVGIIPTDTIYGIVASANNPQAVERLYDLKQREDAARSGTVIAASAQQLIALGVDEAVVKQVARLWPNPLSIELPLSDKLGHLFQSGAHRAFRVVADPVVRALLEQTGPLLTTSVNRSGLPAATNLAQAKGYFGSKVDFYVEGGDLSGRPPSTVVVMREGKFDVVRPGAVTIDKAGNLR